MCYIRAAQLVVCGLHPTHDGLMSGPQVPAQPQNPHHSCCCSGRWGQGSMSRGDPVSLLPGLQHQHQPGVGCAWVGGAHFVHGAEVLPTWCAARVHDQCSMQPLDTLKLDRSVLYYWPWRASFKKQSILWAQNSFHSQSLIFICTYITWTDFIIIIIIQGTATQDAAEGMNFMIMLSALENRRLWTDKLKW